MFVVNFGLRAANEEDSKTPKVTTEQQEGLDFNPTISVTETALSIQFSHTTGNLQRVIDLNGEGPEQRYIIRYAPGITNSQNPTSPVTGAPNDPNFNFSEDLDLSTLSATTKITVEVYDTEIDYADPMSLSEPKGKGSIVVNDNTSSH